MSEYIAAWHVNLQSAAISNSQLPREVSSETNDHLQFPLRVYAQRARYSRDQTADDTVGPCCETHFDPCSQELYQFENSRKLVIAYRHGVAKWTSVWSWFYRNSCWVVCSFKELVDTLRQRIRCASKACQKRVWDVSTEGDSLSSTYQHHSKARVQVHPAGQAGYPISLVASLDTVPVKCCVPLQVCTR